MTAHKHAEMIKAKADNMELVVFCKGINDGCEWHEVKRFPNWQDNASYFLCLPKHKEACLHWLNGGEVEFSYDGVGFKLWNEPREWSKDHAFMCDYLYSRINRKEKRWIGYHKYRHTTTKAYATKDDAKSDTVDHDKWQFIEIEVEV